MISRRRFLSTVGGLGTIAIAGCADSESTSEIELVESDFEADSDSFIGLFGFENESEEEDSIEFSTEVQIGTDGVYGTHRNDTTVTVPSEGSITEEMVIIDRTRLSEAGDNEYGNGYRTISLFIDGNETESAAIGDQPSRHVSFRVLYDGTWQGAMGEEGSTRTIQGAGNSHLSVSDDAFVVSGNAQKQDDSSNELIVQIIVDGNVIAEEATTGGFGIAQVAAEPSESPLNSPRVPYEPEDVYLGDEQQVEDDVSSEESPSDEPGIPSEQEAFEVGEEFFQALSQRDIERYDSIISPIAENEFVFENNIPESDIVTSYEVVDIEIRAIQEAHKSATIEIDYLPLNADGESITDSTVPYVLHLHVDDDEWKFFDGGDGTNSLPIGFTPIYMDIGQVSIDPERDELSISYSMDSPNNFLEFETSIEANVKPQHNSETVYESSISSYRASGSIELSDIKIPDGSDVEIFVNNSTIFNSSEDIGKVIDSSEHPTGITYDGDTGVTESYMELCIANCDV